jgi:hypothetical protein
VTARRGAALLVATAGAVLMTVSATAARAAPGTAIPQAIVFVVHGASMEELVRAFRPVADAGGAALLSHPGDAASAAGDVVGVTAPEPRGGGVDVVDLGTPPPAGAAREAFLGRAAETALARIRGVLGGVQVYVVSDAPSPADAAAGDTMGGIVAAFLRSTDELAGGGSPSTFISDSTRRDGVVVGDDLERTIVDRGGMPTTSVPEGSLIRIVDAPPPFGLHDRYLAMRRMWVPVQVGAVIYVTLAGLFCIAVLARGRRGPVWLGVLATGAAASVAPLATALLAAGHLPSLSYATVVPFVVVVTLAVTSLVVAGAAVDLLHPMLPLAIVVLAYFVVEAALGWTGALTPFLGGAELDGGRFYGLPNVFIGLILGACLYAASRVSPAGGFALLLAGGLFAGLPNVGANLGGAVTLFAAAGLWLPIRRRGRLGARELLFALVTVIVGTAVVLVANRLSPLPTHITTFEETAGAGGAWSAFVDRLGVGVRLIEQSPFAIVPVLGLVAMLAVMLRPPALVADSLARHPAWRDALLVLVLASVVAYVVNDSGPAACGVGFGMAVGGLLYVSVAERTWKMVPA